MEAQQLPLCLKLISLLLQEYVPDLYSHFLDISLEAHMYASQWFLTLFTAKFPLYMVFHIIDLLLCEVCIGAASLWGLLQCPSMLAVKMDAFLLSYFISVSEINLYFRFK